MSLRDLAALVIDQALSDARLTRKQGNKAAEAEALDFLTGSGVYRTPALIWFGALDLKPLDRDTVERLIQ